MKVAFKSTLLLAFALIAAGSLFAQTMVNSVDYSALLENTLKHSVPAVMVSDVNPNTPNIVFLDAREKNEFKVSHLDNAVWVGYSDFDLKRVKDVDKNAQIVVYCSIGVRSEEVCEKLIMAGYLNAQNLYGGIFEWVNQGNTVMKKGNPTAEVHAYDQNWGKWLTQGTKVY